MAIDAIVGSLPSITPAPRAAASAGAEGFASSLGRLVAAAEGANAQANDAVGRMLDGTGDVHEAMIALQRADMALQLTVQIRNKFVNAYQEIMRMPI